MSGYAEVEKFRDTVSANAADGRPVFVQDGYLVMGDVDGDSMAVELTEDLVDQLAEIVYASRHPVDSTTRACCGGIGGHTQDCNPVARTPREITSVEEVRAMPVGSIILDAEHVVMERVGSGAVGDCWVMTEETGRVGHVHVELPARVLYVPEVQS